MNVALDPPRTVLLAGTDPILGADHREAIRAGAAADLRVVGTLPEALDGLETGAVGPVILGEGLDDAGIGHACERITEAASDRPLIVALESPSADLPGLVRAGATDYVTPATEPSELRERVDKAFEEHDRRWRNAEERAMFEGFLSAIGTAVYVKDAEARHLTISDVPGAPSPERVAGKTDLELYGDEAPAAAREAYEDDLRVIESREPIVDKDERVDRGDDVVWMRTRKVPWVENDEVRGLFGLTVSITDLKRAEHQRDELEREFETFASQLRHDLKSPLQVATGKLALAREGKSDLLEDVERAIERIEEVVEDYHATAQQTHRGGGTSGPVALETLADAVWADLDTEGHEFENALPRGLRVNAGARMLRPVLENLLKNAVEHTDPGTTVRVGETGDGFFVEDTGDGLPPDVRERVTDSGVNALDHGAGLGLQIVATRVAERGWSLDVTESPAGGARFVVEGCRARDLPTPTEGEAVALDGRTAVGTLKAGGRAEFDHETERWTLVGDGDDVFRQDNDFYFAHAQVDGPVTIQARVTDVEHARERTKGGLMVRGGLDESATYGYVGQRPSGETELLWRETTGADGRGVPQGDQSTPVDWYRLDRDGGTVTASVSIDGRYWETVEQWTIDLEDPVYVGLVVCSSVSGSQVEATFEDVDAFRPP